MMYQKELLEDTKALAGFPLFLMVIVISVILGEYILALALAVGLVLSFALTAITRTLKFTPRPVKQSYRTVAERIDASSFPSLHAMRAGVLAIIFGLFFGSVALDMVLACAAIIVGIVRVVQKRHFPKDVVAGLLLGVVVGAASVQIASMVINLI